MKIGIATYHHVINDGAVLQAYAQQQALQKFIPGAEVEIIDFRYKIIEERERFAIIKDFLKFRKSAWHNYRKYVTVKRFIRTRLKLSQQQFTSDTLDEAAEFINARYDAIVVGSDEVWKIDYKKFSRPFPNLYWLPETLRTVRIASAATANTLDLSKLRPVDKAKAGELLRAFNLIGVRDQFTSDFVHDVAPSVPLHLMPDPTFGLEFDEKIYMAAKNKLLAAGADPNKPLIALSLSSNIPQLRNISEKLFSTFSNMGCQVVSIGQFNQFSHLSLVSQLDPLEWAHVYRFFEFCITDRFHSTIFSIRNNVNFVAVDFSDRYKADVKGKIHDLLGRVSLLDHHLKLRSLSVSEAVSKILEVRESGKKSNFQEQLRKIDGQLSQSYISFVLKIKSLLESR